MQLYNKLSAEERAQIIDKNSQERITLSFYKYFNLGNPSLFRDHLFIIWSKMDVLGRIYIAKEGINAQLSVPKESLDRFKKSISEIVPLNNIRLNIALEHYSKSFLKLTIKIREKIVADGLDDLSFDVTKIGEHLDAQKFNQMLNHRNTVCIDMRNHYESEIGYFKGAIKPDVDTFRESLKTIDKELEKNGKEKNYLMYCTGGIRCEKSTSYLVQKGFTNVSHLKGGILKYLENIPKKKSLWDGECFVFDQRVSVAEELKPGSYLMCHGCRMPLKPEDTKLKSYIHGVSCKYCHNKKSAESKKRYADRQKQINLALERGEKHMGSKPMASSTVTRKTNG